MGTPGKRNTRSGSSTGISLNDIKQLIKETRDEIISKFTQDFNTMKLEFDSIKNKIESLESSVTSMQTCYNSATSEVANIYHRMNRIEENVYSTIFDEMGQRIERMNNLVIRGIPESDHGTVADRQEHDRKRINELITELDVPTMVVDGIERLGRMHPDVRQRPIRLACRTISERKLIQQKARMLRNSTKFKDTYICNDLTRSQQIESREQRLELKRRRDNGEDVVIYRNKIALRSDIKNFH